MTEKEIKVPAEKVVERVIHIPQAYVPGVWEYIKILWKRLFR